MSENTLSNNFRYEFDELSEEYVIVSAGSYNAQSLQPVPQQGRQLSMFGRFFKQDERGFRPPQPNPPPRPNPPRPNPPPRPLPPPPGESQAVRLSREIYNDLDALVGAYRELARIDNRDEARLQNLENQALIMRATMGNIYRTLSGSALPPLRGDRLELDENYCASLAIVADFISDIQDKMLRLMALVSVSSIDRQLLILNATLSTQERTVTNLYNDCRIREVSLHE